MNIKTHNDSMEKVYITKKENNLIASTPSNECWICDDIINNVKKDKNGKLYIDLDYLEKNDFVEHLEQTIGRKIK